MQYRVATYKDWQEISLLLASTGYYYPIDPSMLGGSFVVARNANGEVVGCLWAMVTGPNAYIDYLALRPGAHSRVAAKLIMFMQAMLKKANVQNVRAVVKADNTAALRLAEAAGWASDPGYSLCFKRL